MRSPTERRRAGLLALLPLLLMGCGTWSNEDLRFYAALPTRDDLAVVVPAGATPALARLDGRVSLVAACEPLGTAETWLWARPTADGLNGMVDWLLGLVDVVRRYPPTTRLADGRIWGPFPDDQHPGNEMRIVILRTYPTGPEGPPRHAYAFEARRAGTEAPFRAVLSGHFVGPSALRGNGWLSLDFEALRALGMQDPDSPDGVMRVDYDRGAEPRTVALTLGKVGAGLPQFDYAFAGYADGRGRLRYVIVGDAGDRAVVAAGFDAAGAGRSEVTYFPVALPGFSVSYRQCWDPAACLVWVDDPGDYSCGRAGCSGGSEGACPPVPAPSP